MIPLQKEINLLFLHIFKAIMSSDEWVKQAIVAAKVAREDIRPYNHYLSLDELEALYDESGNELLPSSIKNAQASSESKVEVKKQLLFADQKECNFFFDESIYANPNPSNIHFYKDTTSQRERMIIAAVLNATALFMEKAFQLTGYDKDITQRKMEFMIKDAKNEAARLEGVHLASTKAYKLSDESNQRLLKKIDRTNSDIEQEIEIYNTAAYNKFKVIYELEFLKILKNLVDNEEEIKKCIADRETTVKVYKWDNKLHTDDELKVILRSKDDLYPLEELYKQGLLIDQQLAKQIEIENDPQNYKDRSENGPIPQKDLYEFEVPVYDTELNITKKQKKLLSLKQLEEHIRFKAEQDALDEIANKLPASEKGKLVDIIAKRRQLAEREQIRTPFIFTQFIQNNINIPTDTTIEQLEIEYKKILKEKAIHTLFTNYMLGHNLTMPELEQMLIHGQPAFDAEGSINAEIMKKYIKDKTRASTDQCYYATDITTRERLLIDSIIRSATFLFEELHKDINNPDFDVMILSNLGRRLAFKNASNILDTFQKVRLDSIDGYRLNDEFYRQLDEAIAQHEAMQRKMPPVQNRTFSEKNEIDPTIMQRLRSYLSMKERTNFDTKLENQRFQQCSATNQQISEKNSELTVDTIFGFN